MIIYQQLINNKIYNEYICWFFFSVLNKNTFLIKKLLILSSLISVIVLFFPQETYKDLWNISWILLIIVMFVRPLKEIFNKCKLFSFLLKFRRELWILVWIFWIAHSIWYFILMKYSSIWEIFADKYLWNPAWLLFWGILALMVSIPLLLTSNNFFVKLLGKKWKPLQRLSYAMFILVAIHIFMIRWEFLPLLVIWIWLFLLVFVYIKKKKKNNEKVWI